VLGQLRPGTWRGCDFGQQFLDQAVGDAGINSAQQGKDRRLLAFTFNGLAGRGETLVTATTTRPADVGALDRQIAVQARPARSGQDSSAPRIVARVGRFLLPLFGGVALPVVPVLRPRCEAEAT